MFKLNIMRAVILFIFFAISFTLQAQNQFIDSLRRVVQVAEGREKVVALVELSSNLYNRNPIEGLSLGEEAIRIAEEMNFPELKGKAYNSIGINYFGKSDIQNARAFFEKAMQEAVRYNDTLEVLKTYSRFGVIYQTESKYDSALLVFRKQEEMYNAMQKRSNLGKVYENIGTIHFLRGEYASAITYFLDAKNLAEEFNNFTLLASMYGKIGGIYSRTKNYAEAEKYLRLAIAQYLDNKNFIEAARFTNILGINFKQQAMFPEALDCYHKALELLKSIPNKPIELAVFSNIASIHVELKEYNQAKVYHAKSLALAKELNSKNSIAISTYNLGEIALFEKDYPLANTLIETALESFIAINDFTSQVKCYNSLIVANNALGNFKKSVEYYKALNTLNDSIFKKEKGFALDSLQTLFSTREIERENLILAQEKKIINKTVEKQRVVIVSGLLFSLLLIFTILFVVQSRRRIKNSKDMLEIQNAYIIEQSEELRVLNEKLVELDKFKASLMQMIVHDLKNPLSNIISIASKRLDKSSELTLIHESANRMLRLVLNILDINKYNESKLNLRLVDVPVKEIVDSSIKNMEVSLSLSSCSLSLNYEPNLVVIADLESMQRVMENLLSNAIKHTYPNENIEVSVFRVNDMVRFRVSNKGAGIPNEKIELLFEPYGQIPSEKQQKFRSTGLGLNFCKLVVTAHGGVIGVESIPETMTHFWFDIPASTNTITAELPETVTENISFSSTIVLSNSDKEALKPFLDRLKNLDIYEVSGIRGVIGQIETTDSAAIEAWKMEVENAIYSLNGKKFNELVTMIET